LKAFRHPGTVAALKQVLNPQLARDKSALKRTKHLFAHALRGEKAVPTLTVSHAR